jgi:hypothetical protein
MKLQKRLTWAFIAALYLVTWVGGCVQHSHDLESASWDRCRAAERSNLRQSEQAKVEGQMPHLVELRKDGPATNVNWCIPLLPGVLLIDSDSVIGPLCGNGGAKIVLYYGTGSLELGSLWRWMA